MAFINSEFPSNSRNVSYFIINIIHYYSNDNLKSQRLLLGTHTSGNEQNYLIIAKVITPFESEEPTQKLSNKGGIKANNRKDIETYSKIENKIEIEYLINHQGEVNKARAMPQKDKTNIIASKTTSGEIHIFDYNKHPLKPIDMQVNPEMKLTGHTKEGFGLNWSKLKEGYLLSGSDDHRICIWDITKGNTTPLKTIEEHQGNVEDVDWSKQMDCVFVSCGDDRKMVLWDIREKSFVYCVEAHAQEVNSVQFNPFNSLLLITASTDKTCALWDIRNLNSKLHSFQHHKNDVVSARWNPRIMSIFASSSSDRRVNIWDLSQIDKYLTAEEKEDGPSELLFTHGGHTSKINDIDWNSSSDLTCASVSDDNIIQIWEMANSIYFDADD